MLPESEQTSRGISSATKQLVLLLLLLLSAVALHGSALRKPFFADDYFFLEQARGQSLPAALGSPDPLGNFLRPVGRQLYFWTLSRVGGETPTVFHVANLALFLASLVLVYLLVRRLGAARPAAVGGRPATGEPLCRS